MNKIEIDKKLKEILKKGTLIHLAEGGKYTGMTKTIKKKLIPHGLGFAQWSNSHSYKGHWKEGKFHGWGNYTSPDDYEYSGLWKNNHMSGYGELIRSNGDVYKGEFKNSSMHGEGIYTVPGVLRREGIFKDNESNGKGKTTYLKDYDQHEKGDVREGNFKDGRWHGNFKITCANGKVYKAKYNMGVIVENKKK